MLTEDQLVERQKGLGGSDIAAIAGLSPYKTAVQVYLEKCGHLEPQEMTENQRRGHLMEPIILDEYERITGRTLFRGHETLISGEYPWMIANIDAATDSRIQDESMKLSGQSKRPIIIDGKFINEHSKWQWGNPGTSEMPDYILLQMIHYAIVCNAEQVDVAAWFTDLNFMIYTYQRDGNLEKDIIDMEREFWFENVKKEVPPTPKLTADARALWKQAKKDSIMVSDDRDRDIWETIRNIRIDQKILLQQEEELKTQLQIKMAEHEILSDLSGLTLATWKNRISERFDQLAFKRDHPDLYGTYKKESTTRVFLLNQKEI